MKPIFYGMRSLEKCQKVNLATLKRLTDDLVKLEDVIDPFITHNLRERAKLDEIYTYVGDILISINPYKQLPIYTPSVMALYQSAKENKPPHLFAIADDCYRKYGQPLTMIRTRTNLSNFVIVFVGFSRRSKISRSLFLASLELGKRCVVVT